MRYIPIYLRQGLVVLSLTSGTFPLLGYHYSARPGELDEDELATLHHTFFARLFFDRVVVGPDGGDSGASQSACPSSSCRFRIRCSSLCLNLKNIFSFPTQKQIFLFPCQSLLWRPSGMVTQGWAQFRGRLLYPWLRSPQGRRSLVHGLRCSWLSLRDTEL